jgi:hypothetical protein
VYASAAEKTAAYRRREASRLVSVHRLSQEELESELRRLQLAVMSAREAGDALAQRLDPITALDLLRDLTAYFEERSQGGGKKSTGAD